MNLIENREEMYQFITNEIMPKYKDLFNCTMHILPKELQEDVEFIFKIKENISGIDLKKLDFAIKKELDEYTQKLDKDYYMYYTYILSKY